MERGKCCTAPRAISQGKRRQSKIKNRLARSWAPHDARRGAKEGGGGHARGVTIKAETFTGRRGKRVLQILRRSSVPRRERQLLVLVGVVDGGLHVYGDGVISRDFGGNVEGHDGEHGVAAGRKQGEGRGAGRARLRISRHKQVLLLVLHALHSLLHKVHVLAPVPQRVLPARVEVYDPVHWHLPQRKLAVPVARA